jgi:hypothetical protein
MTDGLMTDNTEERKLPYTKLTTKVKRGSGTRDQDTTKLVTRHPDPETAVENHDAALEHMAKQAHFARGVQPGQDDDEEVEEP